MKYIDFHHHTNHSFDSKGEMAEICEAAVNKGIEEICFTEHFSVNSTSPTFGHMNWEKYMADIQACRKKFVGKLQIRLGIELCEPHLLREQYKEALNSIPFDYILGSVHNIEGMTLRTYMNTYPERDIYLDYFKELEKLVSHADIDVLAHFDLMKRYGHLTIGNYPFSKYQEIISSILSIAVTRNIGLEINTSGWRTKLNESLPSLEVLKLYRELGGSLLTIGSDSHDKLQTGSGFNEAISMAKAAGFTAIYSFNHRKPIKINI